MNFHRLSPQPFRTPRNSSSPSIFSFFSRTDDLCKINPLDENDSELPIIYRKLTPSPAPFATDLAASPVSPLIRKITSPHWIIELGPDSGSIPFGTYEFVRLANGKLFIKGNSAMEFQNNPLIRNGVIVAAGTICFDYDDNGNTEIISWDLNSSEYEVPSTAIEHSGFNIDKYEKSTNQPTL